MTAPRTIPAEVVFAEDPRGGKWTGRFLNAGNVEGTILGRPARDKTGTIVTIVESTMWNGRPVRDGRTIFQWTTPGEWKPNGNRHHWAWDLADAQARIAKWAGRRFRVAVAE